MHVCSLQYTQKIILKKMMYFQSYLHLNKSDRHVSDLPYFHTCANISCSSFTLCVPYISPERHKHEMDEN